MARPYEYVEAPPVTPLPFGLLSAAIVRDDLTGHAAFGVRYEPDACGEAYPTRAACEDGPDYGTANVSVSAAGLATLTTDGGDPPEGAYSIAWGDGATTVTSTPDGATHTYDDAGTYTIVVTDSLRGYRVEVPVTVVDGEATAAGAPQAAAFSKIVTEGVDLVVADPFNLYTIFQCAPVGRDDLEQRAANALRLGEQRALERRMGEQLAAAGAITLHDGDVLHPAEGLAALERFAGQTYGGVPVIHTPRDVGSLLGTVGAVMRVGGSRLESVQGSIIASGGGYHSLTAPDGTPAAADTAWAYVTGTVVVFRGDTDATPLTMSRAPVATNEASVLAERPYAVAWECITAAVQVSTVPWTGGA